ncbi:Prenyltransferase and squalene oxidase repeat family protein [Cryptosporidium felis]|nr:Prenyltransferase and squalene oxidase repeat family protein [Cryptosporidium felis]
MYQIGGFDLFITDSGIYPWYEFGMNEYKKGSTYDDWLVSIRNTKRRYKSFINNKYFDEFKNYSDLSKCPSEPLLKRESHLNYVKRMRRTRYPVGSLEGESTRILMIYWSLHSEELLTNEYKEFCANMEDYLEREGLDNAQEQVNFFGDSDEIVETILRFQDLDGGFGGNFSHMPNVISTYLAVSSLIITGDLNAISRIDRNKMYQFLTKLRDKKTGGFKVQLDGEIDARALYCVSAVASMLHIVTEELFHGIEDYIINCIGFDGGFSGDFDGESHGGYTYCVVSALCILGKTSILDIDSLIYWIVQKQSGIEGGFQGRTNKLVDSCYSFWFTGLIFCVREIIRIRNSKSDSVSQSTLFDLNALISFILICCQFSDGGLIDKPSKPRDLYHTCYALSGLSLSQRMYLISNDFLNDNLNRVTDYAAASRKFLVDFTGNQTAYSVFIDKNDFLNPTDPFLNIRPDKILISRKYMNKNPIILSSNGSRGTEGIGYKNYIESSHFIM